jgi:RNA polymerase sigma-70 factor (ECF subfamily)
MRRDEVESLYEQHGPALLAYACAILNQRAAAEDVLHQVFLKLLKSTVAMPDNPKAYLYRAVRNAAWNSRRTVSREVSREISGEVEWNSNEAWFVARSFRTEEVSVEDALGLQAALLKIPEEQREIIVMKIWGEMTYEEVALVAGISPNTVASRYRYGLSKLRELMAPSEVKLHAEKK